MNDKHFEAWLLEYRRKHKRACWIGRYSEVDVSAAFKAGIDYQRSLAPKGQTLCKHGMTTTVYCPVCHDEELRDTFNRQGI